MLVWLTREKREKTGGMRWRWRDTHTDEARLRRRLRRRRREQWGGKRRACGAKMCVCNVRASDVMSMRLSERLSEMWRARVRRF